MKYLLSLLIVMSVQVSAQTRTTVLSTSTLKKVLGPYPAAGSMAERMDYEILRKLQDTRTEAECKEAEAESSSSLIAFFASKEGPLTKSELKRAYPYLVKTLAVVALNVRNAKKIYKRPRPYITFKDLTPCVDKEGSYAYPSGHTAAAISLGQVLAKRFPKRREAILARAQNIAWNRVLGGVHHPSDLEASARLVKRLSYAGFLD